MSTSINISKKKQHYRLKLITLPVPLPRSPLLSFSSQGEGSAKTHAHRLLEPSLLEESTQILSATTSSSTGSSSSSSEKKNSQNHSSGEAKLKGANSLLDSTNSESSSSSPPKSSPQNQQQLALSSETGSSSSGSSLTSTTSLPCHNLAIYLSFVERCLTQWREFLPLPGSGMFDGDNGNFAGSGGHRKLGGLSPGSSRNHTITKPFPYTVGQSVKQEVRPKRSSAMLSIGFQHSELPVAQLEGLMEGGMGGGGAYQVRERGVL